MLNRRQWQWLSDHHNDVKKFTLILLWTMVSAYLYNFLDVFLWDNKIPMPYYNE